MAAISQDESGKWIHEIDKWDVHDIKKAKEIIRIKYADMEKTPDNIQDLIDELTNECGYDPVHIQRVIEAHFRK